METPKIRHILHSLRQCCTDKRGWHVQLGDLRELTQTPRQSNFKSGLTHLKHLEEDTQLLALLKICSDLTMDAPQGGLRGRLR